MKGTFIPLFIVCGCITLIGCKSTSEDKMVKNEAIKYESRCSEVALNKTRNNKDIKLIKRVEQKFPVSAARRKQQGYVKMEFDISELGKPININVIEAPSGTMFNKSAIKALKQWRYNKVPQTCATVVLNYGLTYATQVVSH
jgi:TonB family protein